MTDHKKPIRIQRKRTKGWKMPENTVYVGRPTKWGNPFKVNKDCTNEEAVLMFEHKLEITTPANKIAIIKDLKGKNLACFCSLDKPCHADILLKFVNNER